MILLKLKSFVREAKNHTYENIIANFFRFYNNIKAVIIKKLKIFSKNLREGE